MAESATPAVRLAAELDEFIYQTMLLFRAVQNGRSSSELSAAAESLRQLDARVQSLGVDGLFVLLFCTLLDEPICQRVHCCCSFGCWFRQQWLVKSLLARNSTVRVPKFPHWMRLCVDMCRHLARSMKDFRLVVWMQHDCYEDRRVTMNSGKRVMIRPRRKKSQTCWP
jgi:hypothetical protein